MAKTKTVDKPAAGSIRPAIVELERLFRLFAPLFRIKDFPQPIITVQTAGRRQALGWFRGKAWTTPSLDLGGADLAFPEINVSAEHLSRGVYEVAATMLHEMVHYANKLAGVKDCSGAQYHNRKFKGLAVAVGLEVEQIEGKGWAATSLGPKLRTRVKEAGIKPEAFQVFRIREIAPASKCRLRKWTCPCGVIIRAAGDIEVRCMECGGDFERDD